METPERRTISPRELHIRMAARMETWGIRNGSVPFSGLRSPNRHILRGNRNPLYSWGPNLSFRALSTHSGTSAFTSPPNEATSLMTVEVRNVYSSEGIMKTVSISG